MERWIEVTEAAGTRRSALQPGLTRIGGGDADVSLGDVGEDQLHLWDDPPRLVFVGGGVPPAFEGVPFTERQVASGDRIRWGGAELEFGLGQAQAPTVEASIMEISSPSPAPGRQTMPAAATGSGPAPKISEEAAARIANRMRAGLLVDLGLADRGTLDRQQKRVLDGSFSVDECAREIVASARPDEGDRLVLERAGRLMRDFLMAPLNSGVRAASRTVRRKTRGVVAFAIAQGLALLVFALIVALCLFFIRLRGVSLDRFFDGFASGGG